MFSEPLEVDEGGVTLDLQPSAFRLGLLQIGITKGS